MNIWINGCMDEGRKGEREEGRAGEGGNYMNAWNNGRSVHAWMGRCVRGCMDGWMLMAFALQTHSWENLVTAHA